MIEKIKSVNDTIGRWVEERVPYFWLALPVVLVILLLV
jgi:hypothetical protein